MATGTLVHWRLPPVHVATFFDTRCIFGENEVADSFFRNTVLFADGSSTRDPWPYLAALGLTPEDISKLGVRDLDTLRSLFRQVVTHNAVSFPTLVCNLILGEANACLLPPVYQGLFLGSRFKDWASAQAFDTSSVSSSSAGVLNRAFCDEGVESAASNLTHNDVLSSVEVSSEEEVDMDLDVDSGTGSAYAWASSHLLQAMGRPKEERVEVAELMLESGDMDAADAVVFAQ